MKLRIAGMLFLSAVLLVAGPIARAEGAKVEAGTVTAAQDDFLVPAPPPMAFTMPLNAPASPMAGAMHLMMMLDTLDLDAQQREEVGRIMDTTLPKARDLMFRMSDSRKAMEKARDDGVADEKALRKLADEHGRLAADMMFLHLKARAELRAVLNEEQIGQLEGFTPGRPFFHRFHGKRHD